MYEDSLSYAHELDHNDPLKEYRHQFHFPIGNDNKPQIYLCGNSLGLQPTSTAAEIDDVLKNWQKLGVEGHFHGDSPWMEYNDRLKPSLGRIVGGHSHEIAIANTLTVNLQLLMISFYRPDQKRYKIIIEKDAFPSDKYAVASHVRFHGYDPEDAVIEVNPKPDHHLLKLEDFEKAFKEHAGEIALVMVGGVNYFTGQRLPIKEITQLAHEHGSLVGIDLAHAVGNVPLHLHDDDVDFAVWCNYKYVNSGPGSIAAFFVHERHHNEDLPRLEGWWGNHKDNRFEMLDKFTPAPGAEAWVMSTPPTLAIAPLKASLSIFDTVGMDRLREKSRLLTGYLEYLINELENDAIQIISPEDPEERGCQLSIAVHNADKRLYDLLLKKNVVLDWREPNVLRVSPAPLYNSFSDVFQFKEVLKKCLIELRYA